jgi:F0F1-type ATP synthase membrane subunit b/b'
VDVRTEGAANGGDPLARLLGDEAELERSVRNARASAAEVLEGARREAERLASEARAAAEAERDALRADAADALAAAAERAREADLEEAEALRRRAQTRRERALARVLEVVRGEAP